MKKLFTPQTPAGKWSLFFFILFILLLATGSVLSFLGDFSNQEVWVGAASNCRSGIRFRSIHFQYRGDFWPARTLVYHFLHFSDRSSTACSAR
ncbi:hypothetical protein EQV77_06645 [Halobacillus fulvus]|nr:hypothetical protein EQV77_06645 [Halobacillus fulvus]